MSKKGNHRRSLQFVWYELQEPRRCRQSFHDNGSFYFTLKVQDGYNWHPTPSAALELLGLCYATLHPALLIRQSVFVSVLLILIQFFRYLQAVFALLLLSKSIRTLVHHCSCPPARNLGSRVSGLVPYQLPSNILVNWWRESWNGRSDMIKQRWGWW